MSIAIYILTEADLDMTNEVVMTAYGVSESRRNTLRRYLELQPERSFVAKRDDIVVGFGAITEYGPFAYVGSMAVHPNAQRQGVGQRIFEHILAHTASPAILLDASSSGAPLYTRYGFVEEDETLNLVLERQEFRSDTIPDNVALASESDLPAIIAFDAALFGAERAAVIQAYWADNPGRSFVTYNAEGRVSGFLIAQPGVLGPWVASTEHDAERLLLAALMLPLKARPNVFVSTRHSSALDLLARYGFTRQRSLKHMARGPKVERARQSAIYGQTSLGLG